MRFHTKIELGGKTATGIPVPEEVVDGLGSRKRQPVRVTINDHTYRSAVAPYGGAFMISLSAENRSSAGVAAGDERGDAALAGRRTLAFGLLAAALCGLIFVLGVVILVLPNSVHMDTAYADDVFFSCGNALYPDIRPAEEPGISGCQSANGKMATIGAYVLASAGGGLLVGLFVSASGLRRSRQRQDT